MGLQLRFGTSYSHPMEILVDALCWLLIVVGLTVGGLMGTMGYLVAKDGYRFGGLAFFSVALLVAVGSVLVAAVFLPL